MNSMERKNETHERKKSLEQRLSQCFEQLQIWDNLCFRKTDGTIFSLSKFPGKDALVIEYAESYEEALLHRFEDGDLFYLDDMSADEMFAAMRREIEA